MQILHFLVSKNVHMHRQFFMIHIKSVEDLGLRMGIAKATLNSPKIV